MAKFAPKDEKQFNPITDKLLQAVSGAAPATTADAGEELLPVRRLREAPSKVVPLQTPATEYTEYENAERLTRQMRYQATPTEELETKEFLRRLSLAVGTSLTHSNLMRACRDLLLQVEDKLVDELRRANLRRPINDKHAIARFEARLTEAIRVAVRQNPLPYNRGQ
jgi:hypothetical protein